MDTIAQLAMRLLQKLPRRWPRVSAVAAKAALSRPAHNPVRTTPRVVAARESTSTRTSSAAVAAGAGGGGSAAGPLVLGIESSCDDTAAAVVAADGRVLGESIAKQVRLTAASSSEPVVNHVKSARLRREC